MKKILYMLLAGMVLVSMSCRDEELNPWPEMKTGAFVQLEEIITPVFDFGNINTSAFSFRVNDQFNTVASYKIYASWNRKDTVFLKEVTTFPSVVNITVPEIATAYGVDVAEFQPGDRIDFIGTTTGRDGVTYTANEITQELLANPQQRQGYRFVSYVSCPFVASDIEGTYVITNDRFQIASDPAIEIEVVAGPGENQFTMKNAYGYGMDLIVDVNPATGEAKTTRQNTWNPQAAGFPANYGNGFTEALSGFAFSCAGKITLNNRVSVDLGTFGGSWNFTIEKL